MRTIVTTLLVLFLACPVFSQQFLMKTFGEEHTDRGVAVEKAINDQGYVITGFTKNFGAHGEDVYLVKTDTEGNLHWQKTYGGKGDDNGWAIKKTVNNNYLIAGFSNSFGGGDWDIFIVKTDDNGNEIWAKNFGSNKDEYAWDLIFTSDGNYVIIGQTNNTENGEPTTFLMKIDINGNVIWENQLTSPFMNRAFTIVEGKNNSLFFSGLTSTINGDLDGFIAKATSTGQLEWAKTYGGSQNDLGHSIKKGNDNSFFMFGYSKSYGSSKNSPWLIKINENGDEIWNYTYGSQAEERIVGGYVTQDNKCLMLGYMLKESPKGINVDIMLLQIDEIGNLDWLRTYGGELDEESGQNILVDDEGTIIFTGRTFSQGVGNGDLFLTKY